MLLLCPRGVSKPVCGVSNKKKRTFPPKISTRLAFSDISFVIRLCIGGDDDLYFFHRIVIRENVSDRRISHNTVF